MTGREHNRAGLGTKLRTAWALGLPNLGRVAVYRAGLRLGIHPVQRLRAPVPEGPFFAPPAATTDRPPPKAWEKDAQYFGWHQVPLPVGGCPDWHANPFSGARANGTLPWWQVPDFDERVGDIKTVWEASRFDWVLAMAQRAAAGRSGELDRLNRWLADWCAENPPYYGPNWKCGQEASIRVLHLAFAARLLGQSDRPARGLIDLVRVHLRRIAPAVGYAAGQDNNHGTSEAAGLFVGGSWLAQAGDPAGERWARQGRQWLENRVARLIAPDGSFSQYSTNYHRVVLDTLAMVEAWRRRFGLAEFSPAWRDRAGAAARWPAALVDPGSGDAPNLGANDGARLLPLSETGYRDFRPSVQLAMALFADRRAYRTEGSWNEPLRWLGVALPDRAAEAPASQYFDDGGDAVLRRADALALVRYPRFQFRPSHADPLHLDLWVAGENLLRDAGTFSYAAPADELAAFAGVRGHSTVQFDDREPMPRIGRFLFGDWLQTDEVTPPAETAAAVTFQAAYRDRTGARHSRGVKIEAGRLVVTDAIGGFGHRAVIRWRLRPGSWRADGPGVTDGSHQVTVAAEQRIVRLAMVEGWESRFYLQKTVAPVLEVEVAQPGTVTTEYRWPA